MRNIVHAWIHISNGIMLRMSSLQYAFLIPQMLSSCYYLEIINVIVHLSVCYSKIAVFEVLILHVHFFSAHCLLFTWQVLQTNQILSIFSRLKRSWCILASDEEHRSEVIRLNCSTGPWHDTLRGTQNTHTLHHQKPMRSYR